LAYDDPTSVDNHRFDDPSLWHIVRRVPVFDAHSEEYEEPVLKNGKPQLDADGKPLVVKKRRTFGPQELQEIARNSNSREAGSGDLCPLTIGHTLTSGPETEQPDIAGYARNFSVGRFGPAKKLGVLADFYIKRELLDEVRKYPRRSVELWPTDMVLDPIALLKRTPQRDLGTLTYNKKRPEVIAYQRRTGRLIYQMEDDVDTPVKSVPDDLEHDMDGDGDVDDRDEGIDAHSDAVAKSVMKMMNAHPVWKYMCSKYAAEGGGNNGFVPDDDGIDVSGAGAGKSQYAANGGAKGNAAMWAQVDDAGEHLKDEDGESSYEDMAGDWHQKEKGKNGKWVWKKASKKQKDGEAVRMTRDSEAIRYAKLEQEVQALREENQQAKRYAREQECERIVAQLEAEGYDLDRAAEVKRMADLDKAERAAHIAYVRKYHRQNVTNNRLIRTAPLDDAGSKKAYSKERVQKAIALAESGDMTYEEALQKV